MKTLGQIGYEATLQRIHERTPPDFDTTGWPDEARDCALGKWEAQHQSLRDDWEYVANAIAEALTGAAP